MLNFNLNALGILKERELDYIAPHFCTTEVSNDFMFDEPLQSWIEKKLTGRYFIKESLSVNDSNSSRKKKILVGFEDHKEMTYFLLACPHIRRNT